MSWNGYTAVQNRLGAAYYVLEFCFIEAIQSIILICIFACCTMIIVPEEKEVFIREQASSMYSPSAYFVARTMAELPLNFISPLICFLCTYWLWGFNDVHSYNGFVLCTILPSTIARGRPAVRLPGLFRLFSDP